eukprot:g20496.t1
MSQIAVVPHQAWGLEVVKLLEPQQAWWSQAAMSQFAVESHMHQQQELLQDNACDTKCRLRRQRKTLFPLFAPQHLRGAMWQANCHRRHDQLSKIEAAGTQQVWRRRFH